MLGEREGVLSITNYFRSGVADALVTPENFTSLVCLRALGPTRCMRSPLCALSTLARPRSTAACETSGVRDGERSPLGTAACRCAAAIAYRPLRSRALAPRALARVTA